MAPTTAGEESLSRNRTQAANLSDLSPADQRLVWRHLSSLRRRRRLPSRRPALIAKAFIAVRDHPPLRKPRWPAAWSDLPPELLPLISRHLTSIWDYLRFRGVCSSWRSAAGPPPHIPSLLLPYDPGTTARSFLDPCDLRVTTIDIPEARGKWIYGTPHGWLVMLGQEKTGDGSLFGVSLLNPITARQILLPPLPNTITQLPEQCIGGTAGTGTLTCTKPVLTADPTSSSHDDFLALLIFLDMAICRIGGNTWTVVDLSIPSAHRIMVDFAYLDGAFYAVDTSKGVTLVRTKSMKKQYRITQSNKWIPYDNRLHLVQLDGDLLLLERIGAERVTEVFKLDRSNTTLKWVKMEVSLGDMALFVSRNVSSMSVPSSDFMGCKGDLICYAGCGYEVDSFYSSRPATLCISDLVAGSSVGHRPNYWQGSRRACKYGDTLNGLTWIIPSLC